MLCLVESQADTGRYAWKKGMQRGNIEKFQPLGRSGDSSVQVS